MDDLQEYFNSPIVPDYIPRLRYRRFDKYEYEKHRIDNLKLYSNQLLVKATQNIKLMQNYLEFAKRSLSYQGVCINQISSLVSYNQKEIDMVSLEDRYKEENQKLREGYKEKVDSFKEKVDLSNQTKLSLLNELNQQADEAESEANELTIKNREQIKKEVGNYVDENIRSLKQQLKEAQSQIATLQNLSDKATLARKRIDEYKSLKNQQKVSANISGGIMMQMKKHKHVPSSSRVADQFRTFQEKTKITNRVHYSPSTH